MSRSTLGELHVIVEIAEDAIDVKIQLSKVGRAKGRLLTRDGSQPAAGVKLSYGIFVSDLSNTYFSQCFGGSLTTEANGEFTLQDLVPGWESVCNLARTPGGSVPRVVTVKVEPGNTIDLGDLKTPEPPKPYTPSSPDDRIKAAFDTPGRPLQRFERAKQRAKLVTQNVMIMFAHPNAARVQALMQVSLEDPDFRALRDDFLVLAIPTEGQRLDAAEELAAAMQLSPLDASNEFLLAVVDRDGNVVGRLSAEQLCDGDKFSKELEKHRIVP